MTSDLCGSIHFATRPPHANGRLRQTEIRNEHESASRRTGCPPTVADVEIVSTTLHEPLEWNATLIDGNVAEEIAELKRADGGEILMYGSPTLMRTLAAHGLVDEYRFWVHPIILGAGKRLFADEFEKSSLDLVDVKSLSTGVVILTYSPARS